MLFLATPALPHHSPLFSFISSPSFRSFSLSPVVLRARSETSGFLSGLRQRPMPQPFALGDSTIVLSEPGQARYHSYASVNDSFRKWSAFVDDGGYMRVPCSNATTSAVSESSISSFLGENDLLVVGPGVLGKMVAEKWQQDNSVCHIVGQTMTTNHHDELVKLGIEPSLKGTSDRQYPNIIFCAPSSRSADYPGQVRLAILYWNGEGSFLFTSSTAVYDCNDNGICDEDCPIVPFGRGPRTDVLLEAENVVLEAGGCVLRLAGLYKADRGAHAYYLEKGIVDAHPDHILNLIHYEDAATLSTAIMKKGLRGRVFLACDNYPLSRQELMDCVNLSGKYSKKFQAFTGTIVQLGKRMNNSKTRAEIGWEPKYRSFPQFLGLPS